MRIWGLGLGLALAVGAQAATSNLPPGAVLIDASTRKSDPARLSIDAGALLERLARGDDAGAIAALQAIHDPLAYELTAARIIQGLSPDDRQGEALLAHLAAAPPRVFRRHEETQADWFLPVFDLAGQAKSLRDLRDRRARAQRLRLQLLSDPGAVAKRDAAWPEAIALLSAEEVDRVADALLAKRDGADPGAVVALAPRTPRAAVWDLALDVGDAVDVLPLFAQVDAVLAPSATQAWLERAARDPRYASAAVLAGARLPGDDLVARLDDPALGASAAAALAQREGEALVGQVDALTGPKASALRLRHVALALRLLGTPAAQERLRRLAQDPRLPAHVRTELQR